MYRSDTVNSDAVGQNESYPFSKKIFLSFVFGGHMSFFGATGTPVLDFW